MPVLTTTAPEPHEPGTKHDRPRRSAVQLVTSTIARPAVRNGGLSLLDQAVVSGTSFVTNVIIGRTSKEELGVFFLGLTLVYLARGVQEQIVSSPYAIFCHRRRDASLALYSGSALLHHLVLSAACWAILLGILGILSLGFGPPGFAPVVWVLLGVLPFVLLREFVRRLSIAHLEMGTAIAIDIVVALLQLGSLLALRYYDVLNVPAAYATMGGACAIASCGWFLCWRRPLQVKWSNALGDWRHNWVFARWAMASHLIGCLSPYLMPWFMTLARGEAAAGVFAACISLVGVASMFMTGVATYLTPKAAMAYAHGGVSELRHVLRVTTAVYLAVLGAFAVFALVTGDLLLVLVYGQKYAGYGPVLGILAVSMTVLSLGLTAGNGLWAINRPSANFTADVASLATTLTIVFCLVGPLGIYGAALADLGGNVTGAVVRYATLRRLLRTVRQGAESL